VGELEPVVADGGERFLPRVLDGIRGILGR
jgi:hypothetical protein